MLPRWSRAVTKLSRLGSQHNLNLKNELYVISCQSYGRTAAAVAPDTAIIVEKPLPSEPVVNLDKLFLSKPCSLALAPDSPLRIEEPQYAGFKHAILRLMLFYSKQSRLKEFFGPSSFKLLGRATTKPLIGLNGKGWIVVFALLISNQPIDRPCKEPHLGLGSFTSSGSRMVRFRTGGLCSLSDVVYIGAFVSPWTGH
ncbi:hypothetical protein L3X38_019936 [Prunus dulcis]|uniref:Uncharacterized protein n=1 Tax=Prunus dulcis TaxID=3755 RepID=A0AAD4WE21_PRUDU|nr:hypothetical protein L3X38_019936 [Prunus dulcis]